MKENKIIPITITIIACTFALLPFCIMILLSFNSSVNIKSGAYFSANVKDFALNLEKLFLNKTFISSMRNTILISSIATIVTTVLSSILTYFDLVYGSKLTKKVFRYLFIGIIIPGSGTIVALFNMVNRLDLYNNISMIIMVSLSLSYVLLMLYKSAKHFPYELINVAKLDGINDFKIFIYLFCRCMRSPIIVGAGISFLSAWNNLLTPLVLLDTYDRITLMVFISSMNSQTNSDMGLIMVALLISSLPTMILFLLLNQHFLKSQL